MYFFDPKGLKLDHLAVRDSEVFAGFPEPKRYA